MIKQLLHYFVTGFSMGAADIVPGVSGGTIAFIFGIYERLLVTIKDMSSTVPKLLLKGKIKEAWAAIPFSFLMPIGLGVLTAIAALSSLLEYLFEAYPVFIWSFFFGLVVASVVVVSKRVTNWNTQAVLSLVAAALAAYLLVGAVPVQTPATLLAFFLAGAVAICAMILPGVSGAFLLLIMGKYEQVLSAVTNREILVLAAVGLGAVLGLALFSRLLSWLFAHHENTVVAVLTGFMLGSLRKLWPWKEALVTRINSHGVEVPVTEANLLPHGTPVELFAALALALTAIGLVILLDKKNVIKEEDAIPAEK